MVFQSNRAVPFKITNISHGFQEADGLLKLDKNGLKLEFEVKDAIIGLMSSGVKNVLVPYGDLVSIIFKRGVFGAKIILEGVSMKAFDELPGVEVATCSLKIKRKNRKEAEQLVSKARVALSEYRLNEMSD